MTTKPTCRLNVPFQGTNIRVWAGFKHLMYLAEGAVLEWFRQSGAGAQRLFERHGIELGVIDSSVQLPALVKIDDSLDAYVTPTSVCEFAVKFRAEREDYQTVVLNGKIRVALAGAATDVTQSLPDAVAAMIPKGSGPLFDGENTVAVPEGEDVGSLLARRRAGAVVWSWPARYFYCQFSERVQHSAYVGILEEAVDRFLASRGISVGHMLKERHWIPVVSRARVRLLSDAYMEETIHTVFWVDEILKDLAYWARMECYVARGYLMVRTAAADILHGYASADGGGAGKLVAMDEALIAALIGVREP